MKLSYLAAAAVLALSSPAYAGNDNGPKGGDSSAESNSGAVAGAAALSGSSSNAVNTVLGSNNGGSVGNVAGGAGGAGGRADASSSSTLGNLNSFGGSATAVNGPNTNLNTNTLGQAQGQIAKSDQSQAQSLNNTNTLGQANSQTVGGQNASTHSSNTTSTNVTFNEAVQRRQVSSAHAPVVVNVASCALGGSVAGQGPGFGFALGGAKIDKSCDTRANAQILFQLGETEAAVLLMSAHNEEISRAVTTARTRK